MVMSGSLPHKIYLRQIHGAERNHMCRKPKEYFEKCPENLKIPLRKIANWDNLKNGHVYVGFTPDGKYLLSYQSCLKFDYDSAIYSYTLHWWLFDLWRPLKKVREVQLFAHDQQICHELLILICQPPNADYIVVHGSTIYSVDSPSNYKITYVSVIPTKDKEHSIHLRYELLPPHPPFDSFTSLRLPDVILLNSGDMVHAILVNRTFEDNCYCERLNSKQTEIKSTSNENINFEDNYSELNFESDYLDPNCSDNISDKTSKNADNCTEEDSEILTFPKINSPCMNSDTDNTRSQERCTDITAICNKENYQYGMIDRNSSVCKYPLCGELNPGYACNKLYLSYVIQGFSLPADEESSELSPASPFDYSTAIMPCFLTSFDGKEVLKHTYQHRCFHAARKGTKDEGDFFVCQAQFDAESFVNEELQMNDETNHRYVSMRDYDMQIVDVCEETKNVVILINALVIFRDNVQKDRESHSMNTKNENRVQQEDCYKLLVYTLGYIVSWNIYTGHVTVIKRFPIVEGPGTICKSRQFAPSFSQIVELRKSFYVPNAKNASVQTLSNSTTFSGNSLQCLINPFFSAEVVAFNY